MAVTSRQITFFRGNNLKVEWNNSEEPQKGFQYVYLTPEDYKSIQDRSQDLVLKASLVRANGDSFANLFLQLACSSMGPHTKG